MGPESGSAMEQISYYEEFHAKLRAKISQPNQPKVVSHTEFDLPVVTAEEGGMTSSHWQRA